MKQNIPIDVVHMLPLIDSKLMELLRSLDGAEWQKRTVAKLWTVKDVAAHLLDGNIRILSILRDGYRGEHPTIHNYQDLLDFLNGLNADWVKAMKRVSPEMLILLHELTGPLYCRYYASLDPFDKAGFAVDWAGESESRNWMHIAREYTEKFLHQQQIRDAVGKPGIMTEEYFSPFIDIFMLALPHTFRNTVATDGTTVQITVTGEIGGSWYLTRKEQNWQLSKEIQNDPATVIQITPEDAWKLFSKSLRPEHLRDKISIQGDHSLAATALGMVSVMA
jgi:uncharacterized protein (TIGR03083 family)